MIDFPPPPAYQPVGYTATVQPPPQPCGPVRIFMADGFAFDVDVPVPWEEYIGRFTRDGYVLHGNMWINRQFVVRIVRWPDTGGRPPEDDGKVIPLKPIA